MYKGMAFLKLQNFFGLSFTCFNFILLKKKYTFLKQQLFDTSISTKQQIIVFYIKDVSVFMDC